MDLRKLKTLIDLVAESGISELEVTEAEGKVRIVKAPQPAVPVPSPAPVVIQPPSVVPAAAIVPAMATPPVPTPSPAAPSTPEEPTGQVQKSPMVGTFYSAAGPGKPPFVEVGSTVKAGDVLCIIEAMKLLNEIESEFSGTIKAILVENGQPVEYGQPLFVIE